MELRQQHQRLIGRPLDGLAYLGYLFTEEERRFLNRYGVWLDALANGTIRPMSPEQEAFISAAAGKTKSETFAELLWLKWRSHYVPWRLAHDEAIKRADEKAKEWLQDPKRSDIESGNHSFADDILSSTCNACGSNSPYACRCSQ